MLTDEGKLILMALILFIALYISGLYSGYENGYKDACKEIIGIASPELKEAIKAEIKRKEKN